MTLYATVDQFRAQTAHLDLDTPDDIGALLDRAARDVDTLLSWPAPIAAGDRIDTSSVSAYQRDVLTRAVCSQAAYRLVCDEESLTEDRPRVLSVGGLSFAGPPYDRVGPDVIVLLSGCGLLKRSGTAPPDPEPADLESL